MNGMALCAGVGGLELGLRIALGDAYRTVCYVEREAFAAACLVARMEEEALDRAPVWDDLATFDGRPWRGLVDVVTAGYPCQPFSVAGKRRGASDPRHLWPHVARIIGECEPRLVFLENVAGHLNLGFGEVTTWLEDVGFRLKPGLFSAPEVGAPHERERLFVLAHREGGGTVSEKQCGRWNGAVKEGEELAITPCRGFGESRKPSGGNGQLDGRGESVAYAKDPNGRSGVEAEPGEEGRRRTGPGVGRIAVHVPVSNSCQPGREGCQQQTSLHRDGDGTEAHGPAPELPGSFPPRPDDLDAWARILCARPDLAPAVKPGLRLLVDGIPCVVDEYWADRIRACGNGVVPVCAAKAFVTLARKLMCAVCI